VAFGVTIPMPGDPGRGIIAAVLPSSVGRQPFEADPAITQLGPIKWGAAAGMSSS